MPENASDQSWIRQHWEIAKYRASHPGEVYEEQKQQVSRLLQHPVDVTKEEMNKGETILKQGWNNAAEWTNQTITTGENKLDQATHPLDAAKNSALDEVEAFFLTVKDVALDAWHAVGSGTFSQFHFADAWKNDHEKELAALETNHSVAPSHLVPTFS